MSAQARAASHEGFDLLKVDDAFCRDPYPAYKHLRDHAPLSVNSDGTYVVTRWQDVSSVLVSRNVSVDKTKEYTKAMGEGPILEFHLSAMTTWDPPRHTRIRGALAHAFTPRAMVRWESLVEEAVDELLQAVEGKPSFDLVSEFAAALPLTLICKMLGVEVKEKDRFRAWANSIVTVLEPSPKKSIIEKANTDAEDWKTFFRELIAARRKKPADDLISLLIAAEEKDAEAFSELALLHNLALLLSAGHETTTSLLTNAVDLMFQFPGEADRLRKDPSLHDSAVEEYLRYELPVQMGARRTTTPMELSGGTVPAGQLIWTLQGAANRDERQFADPDRFDVGRSPNRQLAFATGIHVCLGAPLARLEGRVAMEKLLTRYPNMRPAGEPERYLRARYRAFTRYPLALG